MLPRATMRLAFLLSTALLAGCDAFGPDAEPALPPDVIVHEVVIVGAPLLSGGRPWDGGLQSPAPDVYLSLTSADPLPGGLLRTRTFGNVEGDDFPLRDEAFEARLISDATDEVVLRLVDDDTGGFSGDDLMWESRPFRFVDVTAGAPTTRTFADAAGAPRVRVTFELVPGQPSP